MAQTLSEILNGMSSETRNTQAKSALVIYVRPDDQVGVYGRNMTENIIKELIDFVQNSHMEEIKTNSDRKH